jgi:hypothetical protein
LIRKEVLMNKKIAIIGHVDHGTLGRAIAHKLADMGVEHRFVTSEEVMPVPPIEHHPGLGIVERMALMKAEGHDFTSPQLTIQTLSAAYEAERERGVTIYTDVSILNSVLEEAKTMDFEPDPVFGGFYTGPIPYKAPVIHQVNDFKPAATRRERRAAARRAK